MSWTEVYRDRFLLAVAKDAGVPTQSTRAGEAGLFEQLQDAHTYVGLHHRLDRPASGLVLFALNRQVNKALSKGFQRHSIRRTYVAVVMGEVQTGEWTWPVAGKPAKTRVEQVATDAGFTALRIQLDTGRKHQIRVHASMAGAPIAGDRRYGAEAGRAWPRLALHATRMTLRHPVTGDVLEFNAPIPEDLVDLWKMTGATSADIDGKIP